MRFYRVSCVTPAIVTREWDSKNPQKKEKLNNLFPILQPVLRAT